MRAILPEEICDGSPSGFAIIGHIGELFILVAVCYAQHLYSSSKSDGAISAV